MFSRHGIVRYVQRHGSFPFVDLRPQQAVPLLPEATDATGLSDIEEADAPDWISNRASDPIVVQTLHQEGGYAITLLSIDGDTP